jgi:predicted metal-dependent phosphoesterase TrpH
MDLVTITDHDSIDGCLEFLSRNPGAPDFFISEEIECMWPDLPLRIHIAAYDINERIHAEVRRLRANVFDVAAYLHSQNVFFALNHLFFFYNRQLPLRQYVNTLLPLCPALEVRNGTMLQSHNVMVRALARVARREEGAQTSFIGGSDSHTLRGIGSTFTEAEGRTRAEYLASLRAGRTRVGGGHGSIRRVAGEIYGVCFNYCASLVGVGRQELSVPRRTLGIAWAIASLPAEFVPLLIAVIEKTGEARRMREFRRELSGAEESWSLGSTVPRLQDS